MSAVLAFAEAARAGVDLHLAPDGKLKAKAPAGAASPALLEQLREHRAELVALLRGDCCRRCGRHLAWPDPVGVVHADGLASCFACYYETAAERAVQSPDALADPAEVMVRGEPLP